MRSTGIDGDTVVMTLGFNVRNYDKRKLRDLASEGGLAFDRATSKSVMDAYDQHLDTSRPVSLSSLSVSDELTDTMQLVVGSVNPPTVTITGQLLEWQFAPPSIPTTLTYRVEPLAPGHWPVSKQADASFVDSEGAIGSGRFPPAEVDVLEYTPTATSTATPTATDTATFTPTPTNTPTPAAIALPLVFRNWPPVPTPTPSPVPTKCIPEAQTVDVAEVIDTSTSMSEPTTQGGMAKLQAAIQAAQELVNNLKADDQVTIVGFNSTSFVETTLTSDRARIAAALAALPSRQATGTQINLGLQAALDELTSGRHLPGNTRGIILVTDGRQVGDPQDVIDVADRIKAENIALVTIGLGGDVDSVLLRQIASAPQYYYEAPNAEDLLRIYREVARYIPCPEQP
jgi:hypothetical protein